MGLVPAIRRDIAKIAGAGAPVPRELGKTQRWRDVGVYQGFAVFARPRLSSILETQPWWWLVKSILIADDNPVMRRLLRRVLERQSDFSVSGEAADGSEAVKKARELKPDLVVLDLQMPEMNGVEAASVLKMSMPGLRVVLFTMFEETIGPSLASAAKIDAILSKPDGLESLVQRIRLLMSEA